MLLILSRKDDEHVRFLLPLLGERGVEHRWIDSGDFPGRATVSVEYAADGGRPRRRLCFDAQTTELEQVRAVWYRSPPGPVPDERVRPEYRAAAARLSRAVLLGLADTLDARWLPGRPRDVAVAQNQMHQLTVAPTLGFTVPRTLVTNDPTDALAFWEACAGRVVARRPAHGAAQVAPPPGWSEMPAHLLHRRDMVGCRALRYAPMVLQEYVARRLELRVAVVGDRVFPCRIDRRAGRAALAPHALPRAVASRCVSVVQAYGLRYATVDLAVTPSGEHVFLELNPTGEWACMQIEAGLPIAGAVVDLLAGRPSSAFAAATI